MQEYIIFVYLFVLAFIGGLIVFLLNKFFKNKLIKFVPAILSFLAGIYYVIQIYFFELEGMLELAYFVMLMLIASLFIGSLATALYLHFKK